MTNTSFDPYRAERRLILRNRIAIWKENRVEAIIHSLALILIALAAGLALFLAWPRMTQACNYVIGYWPVATLITAFAIMSSQHSAVSRRQRVFWQRHWLGDQPIAEAMRLRSTQMRTALLALGYAVAGSALMQAGAASTSAYLIWIAAVVVAALVGWRGGSVDTLVAVPSRRELPFAVSGRGSIARWQWIEVFAVLAPHRLSRSLWLLLLVPTGHWTATVIAVALVVLGVLAMAWSRSLAVMPAAERWLAMQPIAPARLLSACARFPLMVFLCACAWLWALLAGFSALRMALPGSALMAVLASLQFACVAAERARPSRIGIVFAGHLAILFALLQTMPPLLFLAWLLQIVYLFRKAIK